LERLVCCIAQAAIELAACDSGHQFRRRESGTARLCFAAGQQRSPDTLASPVGPHEECPDSRRVASGIQQGGAAPGLAITAKKRRATTPSAAAHNLAPGLRNEVRAVV